jgi:hypothetical protein
MWCTFASPHWRAKRYTVFCFASNLEPITTDFSWVSSCLCTNIFLSNTDPIKHNFVTILWTVAFHSTVLWGYFIQSFLQYFLHEEHCTKIRYMNNFCSTLYLFLTTLQTVFVYISRTANHTKQAVLSIYVTQQWVTKQWFGNQQHTGTGKQISSQPVLWKFWFPEYYENVLVFHWKDWGNVQEPTWGKMSQSL